MLAWPASAAGTESAAGASPAASAASVTGAASVAGAAVAAQHLGQVVSEDANQLAADFVHHAATELGRLAGHVHRGQHGHAGLVAAIFKYGADSRGRGARAFSLLAGGF